MVCNRCYVGGFKYLINNELILILKNLLVCRIENPDILGCF